MTVEGDSKKKSETRVYQSAHNDINELFSGLLTADSCLSVSGSHISVASIQTSEVEKSITSLDPFRAYLKKYIFTSL